MMKIESFQANVSGYTTTKDFAGNVFLDEGDIVLCESPSYLGAINAFKSYGSKFIEVPTDKDGMIMEELEKILEVTENVKMIYVLFMPIILIRFLMTIKFYLN